MVKEYYAQGLSYRRHVYTLIRRSFSHHYRRMVPLILGALTFRSSNTTHQPVIEALDGLVQLVGTLVVPVTLIQLYLPLIVAASLMYYFVSEDHEVVRWEGLMLLVLYGLFLGTVFSTTL